ncbi:MAG: caspase family protein [Hyphomicrobium sp.]
MSSAGFDIRALLSCPLIAGAIWLSAAVAAPARAESRLALVIGNGGYSSRPLANPANDAALITRTLQATGFEVTTLIDAGQAAMKKGMLEFGRRLRASDSVGVFYYAGHGVQIDGENYLIPADADIKELEEVALNGVSLSELMKTMERSGSRLNLAILDACRDNPFASSTRSGVRGLAAVSAPSGTLIAYATAPGHVALDGQGANSPYTAALAEAVPLEGSSLEDVFRRTRRKVLEVTGGRQTPWEHSSLTGEFFFRPKTSAPEVSAREAVSPPQAADARLAEIAAWQAVKGTTEQEALRQFMAAYPEGLFSELATLRLAKLEPPPSSPWPWTVSEAGRSAPEPSEAEGLYEEALKLDGPQSTAADLVAAATLYRRAANDGLPAAMFALGRSYDKGRGVERNLAQAAQWYRAAADKGHAGAMASLGTMYEFGEGASLDLAGAFRLYQQAAELGEANAMTSLGYLYAAGKGVAADPSKARRWYQMAVERGQPRAMFNLAVMLLRGEGGPADSTEAARLLQIAGSKGHAGALRELVTLFDAGRGVPRDPVQAADFLIESYAAANDKSRTELLRRPEVWSLAVRREAQRKLQVRGHYSGRLTGVFDAATRRGFDRMASER